MAPDYVILAMVSVLAVGGGLYLLAQAKAWRARHPR